MNSVLPRCCPAYEFKNVVYGWLVMLGFAVVATIAVRVANHYFPMVTLEASSSPDFFGFKPDSSYQGGSGDHVTEAGILRGYYGSKIRIIDGRQVNTQYTSAIISTQDYVPAVPDFKPGIGEGTGIGIGNGNSDFGLPEFPKTLASVQTPKPPPEPIFPRSELKIKKPKPDHEVIVRFQPDEPRYPYKAGNIKGEATARFIVDEHGNIRDVKIVHESPERSGFGPALQKAFADVSYVDAAVVNGQSIAGTYDMTYYFGTGLEKPKVVASRNMTVILPH